MPGKNIFILTGSIQSGKTTKLIQWSAERKDVFGILTPVINGKKIFFNVHTEEQFRMEAGAEEESVLSIGKFVFSKKAFEKAVNILTKALKEKNGWLVVDEIGPLELKEEGFSSMIKQILSANTKLNILFVVRDSIIEKVKEHYNIKASIITKDDSIFEK